MALVTDEKTLLKEQLDDRKNEIDVLLQSRDASLTQLKMRNHELDQELKKAKERCEAMASEMNCQKRLMTALDEEVSTIRREHAEVQKEVTDQESRMTVCFKTVQSSLTDSDKLLQKIEEQKVTHHCLIRSDLRSIVPTRDSLWRSSQRPIG